jgi:hypothetical protein
MADDSFDFESSFNKISNPENYAGIWFSIHAFAKRCDLISRADIFNLYIRSIILELKCLNCKKHAIDYVQNNEINYDLVSTIPNYLFLWTVDFHNTVNRRIGKPVLTYEEAFSLFEDNEVCTDCGHKDDMPNEDRTSNSRKEVESDLIILDSPGMITHDLNGNELPHPIFIRGKNKEVVVVDERGERNDRDTGLNRQGRRNRNRNNDPVGTFKKLVFKRSNGKR